MLWIISSKAITVKTVQKNMGQQEVFSFLKNNTNKWWTSKQIAQKLNASVGSVTTTLAKLRRQKDIKFKVSEEKKNMYLYKFS